jgi:hypothetical protein
VSEKYRTDRFYNGVSSFKAAFPDLADALVEWRERRGSEDSSSTDLRKIGYRRGNFTQGLLSCSNPTCREGGYQVDRLIAEMLQTGEMERAGTMLCSGREIGEEVRRGPVRCPYRIEYKVTLSLKMEDREPERRGYGRRRRGRGRRSSAA